MSAVRFPPLAAAERAAVEDALDAERAATSGRIAGLTRGFAAIVEASELAVADDEHDPEGATIGFERAQLASLLDQARAYLEQLDKAHERLAANEYGTCLSCGRAIATDRLLAAPAAETCVTCATGANALVRRPVIGG